MTDEAMRAFKASFASFAQPLMDSGMSKSDAFMCVDIALHYVQETERRLIPEVGDRIGDRDLGMVAMMVAAKMLENMGRKAQRTIREAQKNHEAGEDMLDKALTVLLAMRGRLLDPDKDGVIVHAKVDSSNCDCDRCAFFERARAMPGMETFDISDHMSVLVGPIEAIKVLAVEHDMLKAADTGEAIH